jgi:hypothetical protein
LAASSLRSANDSALDEDGSSHWTSSIAITTGSRLLRASSAPRTPTASARRSTGSPEASSTSSATSRARRLGALSIGRTSSRTPSNRSPSPALASPRSASAGRDERTRRPRRASSIPASQRVDFPTPGSPSSTSAAGPPSAWSKKARIEASSSSLPTISSVMLLWESSRKEKNPASDPLEGCGDQALVRLDGPAALPPLAPARGAFQAPPPVRRSRAFEPSPIALVGGILAVISCFLTWSDADGLS